MSKIFDDAVKNVSLGDTVVVFIGHQLAEEKAEGARDDSYHDACSAQAAASKISKQWSGSWVRATLIEKIDNIQPGSISFLVRIENKSELEMVVPISEGDGDAPPTLLAIIPAKKSDRPRKPPSKKSKISGEFPDAL